MGGQVIKVEYEVAMDSNSKQSIIFDIRGQICPSTLLIALREINRHSQALKSGELLLLFRTDNRDSTHTIPESALNMGYSASVNRQEDYYEIAVEYP